MLQIEGQTYTSILKQATSLLIEHGQAVAPRSLPTYEVQNVTIRLFAPTLRYPRLKGRNANIFALLAETIWVLSGRNDLHFIQAYLPRMANFSDDGETLSGGYGPRIRNWYGVDQFRTVVETLGADTNSRRAVIGLFDPRLDHDQSKKDIPCTSLLHFTTQSGRLQLSVYSRSMDIMWGSAINFFEWTVVQEAVAYWLSLPIGTYTHSVGSLHIYNEFLTRGRRFISGQEPDALPITPFDIHLDQLDLHCNEYFRVEALFRAGSFHLSPRELASDWMTEAVELSRAFWLATLTNDYRAAEGIIDALPLSEATAMARDQIAFMKGNHGKTPSGWTPNA